MCSAAPGSEVYDATGILGVVCCACGHVQYDHDDPCVRVALATTIGHLILPYKPERFWGIHAIYFSVTIGLCMYVY